MLDHIFFFNLRSFDRLNKSPSMQRQEEISGVSYQDVQRAHAEEIMGDGLHTASHRGDLKKGLKQHLQHDDSNDEKTERIVDQKRAFESKHDEAASKDPMISADSIARDAMLDEGKVSEEYWEGDLESEKENFVQEELYIHGKVSGQEPASRRKQLIQVGHYCR